MFQLPPSSAKRISDSIRKELALRPHDPVLYRANIRVSPSMWNLVDPADIGPFGRVKLELTSFPDYPALFSLVWRICKRCPSIHDWELNDSLRLKKLTRRERWFLAHVAKEAQEQGVWLCEAKPLTVMFHCAPKLRCVSTCYSTDLVNFILARLDACCDGR